MQHISYTLDTRSIVRWRPPPLVQILRLDLPSAASMRRIGLFYVFGIIVVFVVSVLAEAGYECTFAVSIPLLLFLAAFALQLAIRVLFSGWMSLVLKRKKYRALLGPHMLTLHGDELVHVHRRGEDRLPVSFVKRVVTTPNFVSIVFASSAELLIPRRAFSSPQHQQMFLGPLIAASKKRADTQPATSPRRAEWEPRYLARITGLEARGAYAAGGDLDWLYQLIFQEAARTVAALRTGSYRAMYPQRFYIQQCACYVDDLLRCSGPTELLWIYDGSLLLPLPAGKRFVMDGNAHGVGFVDGLIRFHIMPDRAHVLWNVHAGPRAAHGHMLRVEGEGPRATLEADPAYGSWSA